MWYSLGMKLKNTTDLPNELIREIIRFVRPPGIRNFDVMVKNNLTGHYLGGHAFMYGSDYHDRKRTPFVVLRVTPRMNRPRRHWTYQYGQLKGRRYYLANREEVLVYLAAHELRHLWQAKTRNKAGYAWGSRGRFSEIDTDSYAIGKLREWRRRS